MYLLVNNWHEPYGKHTKAVPLSTERKLLISPNKLKSFFLLNTVMERL